MVVTMSASQTVTAGNNVEMQNMVRRRVLTQQRCKYCYCYYYSSALLLLLLFICPAYSPAVNIVIVNWSCLCIGCKYCYCYCQLGPTSAQL